MIITFLKVITIYMIINLLIFTILMLIAMMCSNALGDNFTDDINELLKRDHVNISNPLHVVQLIFWISVITIPSVICHIFRH